MSGKDNLRPLTTDQAREIGAIGGKKSAESKRKKKLMSQIYGEFLAERFDVTVEGKKQSMTGESLVNRVIKQVLVSGGPSAVSIMKEIREATEGSKFGGADGEPLIVQIIRASEADK